MDKLTNLLESAKVILKSVVAYALVAQTILVLIAGTVVESWPDGGRWALVIAGFLGTAIAAIRKVTPTDPGTEGILP